MFCKIAVNDVTIEFDLDGNSDPAMSVTIRRPRTQETFVLPQYALLDMAMTIEFLWQHQDAILSSPHPERTLERALNVIRADGLDALFADGIDNFLENEQNFPGESA